MTYNYHPTTGELITAPPRDWMGETDIAPPNYDPAVESAVWNGNAWDVIGQDTAPVVPSVVSRRQAKQALILAGLLDQVQPTIDALADSQERALMQAYWDDATEFQRQHQALLDLAASMGLSDADLDDLFVTAGGL